MPVFRRPEGEPSVPRQPAQPFSSIRDTFQLLPLLSRPRRQSLIGLPIFWSLSFLPSSGPLLQPPKASLAQPKLGGNPSRCKSAFPTKRRQLSKEHGSSFLKTQSESLC